MIPRVLPLLALLLVLSCAGGGVQGASARVRVPEAIAFPKTWVGETARTSLLIEAIGRSPVQLSDLRVDSPEITLENADPRTIAGGTSVTVTLAWRPSSAGTLAAAFHVSTDVDDAHEVSVPLSGVSALPPDCEDHDPCTDDDFDHATGACLHRVHDGTCDDGNACTTDDRCVAGSCRGRALTCDDGDVCTRNLCDPAKGCVFPPDGRPCDDGDPCTRDVCDNVKGCSHPDADDGTACGKFSCAEAHVCVFGTCRALDVSGASDGFPCFDGDLCTENDTCQAGACAPGPRVRAEPTVLKTVETFGAAGDFVATDGFRFLFADAKKLRIALRDSAGELALHGSVDVGSTAPPLPFGPARFLTAAHDALTLVDAGDAEHPTVAWTVRLPGAASGIVPEILRFWVIGNGLVAWAREGGRDELLFVPFAPPPAQVGQPVTVFAGVFRDADVDGQDLVVSTGSAAFWLSIDEAGRVLEDVPLNATTPGRVSVLGSRVAVVSGDEVQLHEVDFQHQAPVPCVDADPLCVELGPGCDGTFPGPVGVYRTCNPQNPCPGDSLCVTVSADPCPRCARGSGDTCEQQPVGICYATVPEDRILAGVAMARVSDLVLTGTQLFASVPSGIRILTYDGTGTLRARAGSDVPAWNMEAAPGMLLTWGTIALPLAVETTSSGDTRLVPITGKGLGEVVAAAADSETTVLVAGPHAAGSIDLVSQAVTGWTLSSQPSDDLHPRVLVGGKESQPVDLYAGVDPDRVDSACWGTALEVVDSHLAVRRVLVCGLQEARLDTFGQTLYADGDAVGGARTGTAWHLQAYDLTQPLPVGAEVVAGPLFTQDVRAAADGKLLLYDWTVDGYHVRRMAPGLPPSEEHAFAVASGEMPRRWQVAAEANAWLLAEGPDVTLFRAAPPDLQPTTPIHADEPVRQKVASMRDGRAWISAERADGSGWLQQFAYDPQAPTTLTDLGRLELPEVPGRVFEEGPVTVATSPHAISFIRPACR